MDKRLFFVMLVALFLTGCANNYPPARRVGSRVKPVVKPISDDLLTTDKTADSGKIKDAVPGGGTMEVGPDPLLDNHDGGGLTDKTSADADYDPLAGPRMPTKHSHWLSAYMGKAKVTLTLNGIGMGTYIAGTTRDVTMSLRPGVNTLSVTYEPQDASSYASVTVVEGEHDPPLPPLVNFQQFPLRNSNHSSAETKKLLQPVTQTLTFVAQ